MMIGATFDGVLPVQIRRTGERIDDVIEIFVPGLRQSHVSPELEFSSGRTAPASSMPLVAISPAREYVVSVVWHIDVAPGDVVGGESPLGLVVPKQLFDAGLVDLPRSSRPAVPWC